MSVYWYMPHDVSTQNSKVLNIILPPYNKSKLPNIILTIRIPQYRYMAEKNYIVLSFANVRNTFCPTFANKSLVPTYICLPPPFYKTPAGKPDK